MLLVWVIYIYFSPPRRYQFFDNFISNKLPFGWLAFSIVLSSSSAHENFINFIHRKKTPTNENEKREVNFWFRFGFVCWVCAEGDFHLQIIFLFPPLAPGVHFILFFILSILFDSYFFFVWCVNMWSS